MDSQGAGCGCLVVIIILGVLKSACASWLTQGKYGLTLGESFLVLSEIVAGIIMLVAVCAGIAVSIDRLKTKRAKQGNLHVKPNAGAEDEMQNQIERKR